MIFDLVEETFRCSCRMFESFGLPCHHIFYVMTVEQLKKILASLILKRWTKEAKERLSVVFEGSHSIHKPIYCVDAQASYDLIAHQNSNKVIKVCAF